MRKRVYRAVLRTVLGRFVVEDAVTDVTVVGIIIIIIVTAKISSEISTRC